MRIYSTIILTSRKLYSTFITKMQLPMIIVLFGLILELVEFNETYKLKPYKHYSPHPWRPRRPRWHSLPKHRKRYPKRIPLHKYHYYEPEYHRYTPYHEDSGDTSDYDKPYVIVIQLPHKNEKKKYHSYQRKQVIDPPRNNDYIDDNDELKMYQVNK